MPSAQDLERYRRNRQNELDAASLYRAMADSEPRSARADVYCKLAAVEERHAQLWENELRKASSPVPPWRPSVRLRILRWITGRFSPSVVLPLVAFTEEKGQQDYDDQPEAAGSSLPADERDHARVLGRLNKREGWHRSIGGNALRAAVLGANDGLVSNLSLVMGVVGAQMSERSIIVTGVAGLLAGASSMAIGEWISVQTSRELHERQIAMEADELAMSPGEEKEELSLIYQAKGLSASEADTVAERLMRDPRMALDALVREELGIDPADKGGSAWEAAWVSFLLFSVGAVVPIIPFFFFAGGTATIGSVGASGLGLFVLGASATLITGRSPWMSGLRQLAIGWAAAGLTYLIGHLLGVQLGG